MPDELNIQIANGDLCPCRSGLVYEECCLPLGDRAPLPAETRLPIDTGFRHPNCYASAVGGCSSTISGEHAITQGALNVWADAGFVDIGGMTWMRDDRKTLPTGALGSKILCTNHNRAMSPLDDVGIKLVSHLMLTRRILASR